MEYSPITLTPEWEALLPANCRDCRPLRLLARKLIMMCERGEIDENKAKESLISTFDQICVGPDPEKEHGTGCAKPNCRHGKGEMYLVAKTGRFATQGLESLELQ